MTTRNLKAPARFYPIVPDIGWLKRIAPLGIGCVQLRLKDASPGEVRRQIGEALRICKDNGVQLIVNDFWREAIELGAGYIHLGQEDLAGADLKAIRAAGLSLGISTHDEAELATALKAGPDYFALGPIYETKLKAMKWAPQGLQRITAWRRAIDADARTKGVDAPALVAIGGLTPERAAGALDAGARSLAVITDFLTNDQPERRIREWLAVIQRVG